jgi:hypothetical protein
MIKTLEVERAVASLVEINFDEETVKRLRVKSCL